MFGIAIAGYLAGARVRSHDVVIPIEQDQAAQTTG
jgi:hypothetical protein